MSLPEILNVSKKHSSLPAGTRTQNIAISPNNGSSFAEGQQIQLDLVNSGVLIPDSMYIAYKYAYTNLVAAEMIGTPVYSPFSQLQVQFGSQTVDTMQGYNIMMNTLTNIKMSAADKYGAQSAYGYFANAGVPTLEQLDGRLLAVNETGSFSGPLISMLSFAQEGIPLFAMPQVRLILTLDSLSNYFTSTVAIPTVIAITNFELRYKVINVNGEVEQMIKAVPNIEIKSQSIASSTATLAAATTGFSELVFNQRFASVRNLVAINGTGTAGGNKNFDSCDLTTNDGDYQFSIGGTSYPQKSMSTLRCRQQLFQELRSVAGSLFNTANSMAINSIEWNLNSTAAASTYAAPAKFYVGTNVNAVDSENMLVGVDTVNTPISYRVSTGTSIGANASTVTLLVNYDALLHIDPRTKEVQVRT